MTKREVPSLHEEPVYEGRLGRTRREKVHVPTPSEGWKSLEVITGVNLATEPHLREKAFAGLLNEEQGVFVPFVLHDPAARKFCLVVTETDRHRAMRERAGLAMALAEEPGIDVPKYVSELKVVVGLKELASYCARPTPDQEERALESLREELEALRADVELRERELEMRFEALQERELLSLRPQALALEERTSAEVLHGERSSMTDIDESELEEITEGTNVVRLAEVRGTSNAFDEVVDTGEVSAELDARDVEAELDSDEVEAELDADEVEAELDPDETPSDPDELLTGRHAPSSIPPALPSVAPPPGFLIDPDLEMVAVSGDTVRLFARLDPSRSDAFESGAELLVQLASVQGYPVVLLVLVENGGERPYVRRAALDPKRASHRRVLGELAGVFSARVALYAGDGRYRRIVDVQAVREANVRAILEKTSGPVDAVVDAETACERALAVPPPFRESHPFGGDSRYETAREAFDAIVKFAQWSSFEKWERAVFALSVPIPRVEEAFLAIGEAAKKFGLVMPAALRDRVLELGLAPDASSLLAEQAEAFRRLAGSPGRGGLTVREVASNWEALLAEAAEHEFAIEAETHEEAWKVLRTVRGDTRTRASLPVDVELSKLPAMGGPELVMLLDHPKARRHAAIELAKRADSQHASLVVQAMRKMPRVDVARVAPHLPKFGEAVGDALLDALAARKTFVRHAAVLALGELKSRRAVTPLVQLLATEESDVWRDIARVLGELGSASLRAIAKLTKDGKLEQERAAWALAHALHQGFRKQVEQLGKDDPATAAAVAEALSQESSAALASEAARGGKGASAADPSMELARRFYDDLDGKP